MKDYPVWHPYTQMKQAFPLIEIIRGEGAYLFARNGKRYLDAISSWWTNVHGHCHPHIMSGIRTQSQRLDHVIFAGYTHSPATRLAEELLTVLPGNQKKIFYSDNGSTAVEAGLKMALQYHYNKGRDRNRIIAFRHGYHGDTFGSMSVSGRSVFTKPFRKLLFPVAYIDEPVTGKEAASLQQLSACIQKYKNRIAAFIFEPLVLGAGGMIMYNPGPLNALISLCKKHGILTIADEVMTGFGRTGKFFASDHLDEEPDIFCLSKGLTGGVLPLGVTACTEEIYNAFVSVNRNKTFYHGHSFTANPVCCSAALASLELFRKKATWNNIRRIHRKHTVFVNRLNKHRAAENIRLCGTILAFNIETKQSSGYSNPVKERAIRFFHRKGIMIRPLGNVFYIMPPYCTGNADMDYIYNCMETFLELQ